MPSLVLPNVPVNTYRRARRVRDMVIVLAVIIVAVAAPFFVGDGVRAYTPGTPEYEVATRAYQGAWVLNSNPIARVLLPSARVTRVWLEPGHCARREPGGSTAEGDYRAEVRFYSLFAIPGPVVQARCGGLAYIW